MSIFSHALAQVPDATGAAAEPSAIMNLLPLLLIFAVFYFFLIRPQQKKLKEHETIVNSIKRGDEVITGGGIIGKISKVEEGSNIAFIEIADGVVVRINKATIIDVMPAAGTEKKAEKQEQKSKPEKNKTKKGK